MSDERLWIEGELHLSVRTVARLYEVQEVWLVEACEAAVLPARRTDAGGFAIAAVELDRVARVVWMARGLELDLEAIAWRLDLEAW